MRVWPVALTLLIGATALAQPPKPDPKAARKPEPPKKSEKTQKPRDPNAKQTRPVVTITTDKGSVQIELFPEDAPRNVANLLSLIRSGFYDGLTFHRIEDWVAQGGDPRGDGTGGPGYTVDNDLNHALKHVRGAVGMANSGRDTAGSQFYVLKKDAASLDNGAYTLVGMVLTGLETVDRLAPGDKMTRVSVALPAGFKLRPFGPTRRAEPENLLFTDLPEDSAQRSFQTIVRVKATISVKGSARISLTRGSGDSDVDDAILSALQRWRWNPALKDGQPVDSAQEFEYDLSANTRRYDP